MSRGAPRASAHKHRRLVQKGVVVDLLDEEIRHVGARDEPACPIARIGQRVIGVSLWPLAPADDTFLHVLVVIGAPQEQMKRRASPAPKPVTQINRLT